MRTVLVLDCNERSALAAVRSLGRGGFRVIAGESDERSLAGRSRFADAVMQYPSPYEQPQRFVEAIVQSVRQQAIDCVLPMTEVSQELLLGTAENLGSGMLPMGPKAAFDRLNDKCELMELAGDAGISVPPSRVIAEYADLRTVHDAVDALGGFPIVLKPFRSRIPKGDGYLKGSVSIIWSQDELDKRILRDPAVREHPFLLQQRIAGYGAGVFVVSARDRILAAFAHRRIREKPPSGGVSVLSESVSLDSKLRSDSERLILLSGWNGPAMVEYKVDGNGIAYLMEVNARFWGSLQLSIDAGIDFPRVLVGAENSPIAGVEDVYVVGAKSRWLLGDLDSLYLAFRESEGMKQKVAAGRGFLASFFDPKVKADVFRWNDPGPAIFETSRYIRALANHRL